MSNVRERRLMTRNIGPQHPSTLGVLRLVVELEGETVVKLVPDVGYLVMFQKIHATLIDVSEFNTKSDSPCLWYGSAKIVRSGRTNMAPLNFAYSPYRRVVVPLWGLKPDGTLEGGQFSWVLIPDKKLVQAYIGPKFGPPDYTLIDKTNPPPKIPNPKGYDY